jgi:hypothetical protein
MTAVNCDNPQHREALVNSGHIFFDSSQAPNGESDLLNGSKTQDALIAVLQWLVAGGWHFEVTSVNTDHGYDGNLGNLCHNPCGLAIDGGLLDGPNPGNYVDPSTQTFRDFGAYMAQSPHLQGTGLGGNYYSAANAAAFGSNTFQDNSQPHIHFQCQ